MLRNETQKSWATRGESTCSTTAGCEQQSCVPKAWHLHTLSSLLCAPCCCQSTCNAVGPLTQPGSTALERTIPEGKKGCSHGVWLSSAYHWAFPALGFADFLSLCRLQNHRDLLLDMESILPLAAGLAPVLRSAAALSRWCLKSCKGGNYVASLGCPVHCPQGKTGLSSCLAWLGLLPSWSSWPLSLPHLLQLSGDIWLHHCNCPADNIRLLLVHSTD